ncbi:hypothetical protein [Bradyrhizobium yuanmingense]|uniref:hypothetical protein n=1 Tax=Bradyrhizobium yuanmingense TaxID=108015 RepID=UPI0023B9DDBE|nr:hypothetical protein [Bradyrhizobium yuanmingense]MDF0493754.1 hypothetical protein [Bradyrhizobium yuanmingense]
MTADEPPSLNILGVYSYSSDQASYARFIRELIDFHDPPNFSEEVKDILRNNGRGDEIAPLTAEERQEWEEYLHFYMADAAVVEVLVENPDARFNPRDFAQIDPPTGHSEMAWNEMFLTADGETEIETGYRQTLPVARQYRVVFVIHRWEPSLPLRSSYGEHQAPAVQPLSERLWRLTSYDPPEASARAIQ